MAFEKATQVAGKARVCLLGGPGGGKTMTGLEILTVLGAKKIAVIDSEQGRSRRYANKFVFDVDDKIVDFDPRKYIERIEEAAKLGYDGLLLDSTTHVWSGKNGFLDKVNAMGGNSFSNGWNAMTPVYRKLIETIQNYPGHVVATARVKTEYVVELNDKGKSVPKKLGLKPEQREGFEYEFDFTLNLGVGGEVNILKQFNCPELDGFQGMRDSLPKIYSEMKRVLEIK